MCETIKNTNKCEDIQDTMCLPNEIVNVESAHVLDLIESNRKKYEKARRDMRTDLALVSSIIDKEANELMSLAGEELEMTIRNANLSDLSSVTTAEELLLARNMCEKLDSQIAAVINEYCDDLESLETKRKKENIVILLKYKEIVDETKFLDCNDMEDIFQFEIDDINRKTLSNLRHVADFKLILQVKGRNQIDIIRQDLRDVASNIAEKEAQHLWQKIVAKRNKVLLAETVFSLKQENDEVREFIVKTANSLACSLSDLCDLSKLCDSATVDCSFRSDSQLHTLDGICQTVVALLRTSVDTLMNDFHTQINSLDKSMMKEIESFQDGHKIDDLPLNSNPDLNILLTYRNKQIEELKLNVNEVVDIFNNNIRRVRSYFGDLKSIFTNYLSHINNMHNQIEFEWEEFKNICIKLKTHTISEMKVKNKQIREANSLEKLDLLAKDIEKILNVFEERFDFELKSLMLQLDVKNKNVEKISDENISNIKAFLYEKYQKDTWLNTNNINYGSANFELIANELENCVDKCNVYMNAVDSKLIKIHESLEIFLSQCKDKVVQEYGDWFKIFLQGVISKYNNELLEFLQIERSNVEDVINIRSAELMYHSDRLTSHSYAVKGVISKLNNEFKELKSKSQSLLEEFAESAVGLIQNLPTDTSTQIKFAISHLENKWNSINQTLEKAVKEAKAKCSEQFDMVEHSNGSFSKAAVSFKNGGNYSPEEIKLLSKELKLLKKECVSQKRALFKNYDSLVSEISKHSLDLEIENLKGKLKNVTMDEVFFDEVSTLRFALRSEVENMKTSGRKISKIINGLSSLSKTDENLINDIVTKLNTRFDYMTFPRGLQSFDSGRLNVDFNKKLLRDSRCGTPLKRELRKTSDSETTQFFQNASEEIFTDATNYFTRTKGVMLKKYNHLMQRVHDSFEPSVSLRKNKSLNKRANQNDGSDSVAEKYNNRIKSVLLAYNKQCEFAWHCQAKLFINQITSLSKYINSLTKQELKLNHKEYIEKVECLQKEFQQKIETEKIKQSADRERICQTLVLPLAHPVHQHKLTELLSKASDLSKIQVGEFREMLNVHKDDLQISHDQYVEVVRNLKEKLSGIQSIVNIGFSNKLDDLIGRMESTLDLVQSEVSEEPTDNVHYCEYPKSIWSDDDDDDDDDDDCFAPFDSTSSKDLDVEVGKNYSVTYFATELVKLSADLIQRFYDEAKIAQIENEKRISVWMKAFRCNVDECKLAYKSNCR